MRRSLRLALILGTTSAALFVLPYVLVVLDVANPPVWAAAELLVPFYMPGSFVANEINNEVLFNLVATIGNWIFYTTVFSVIAFLFIAVSNRSSSAKPRSLGSEADVSSHPRLG